MKNFVLWFFVGCFFLIILSLENHMTDHKILVESGLSAVLIQAGVNEHRAHEIAKLAFQLSTAPLESEMEQLRAIVTSLPIINIDRTFT